MIGVLLGLGDVLAPDEPHRPAWKVAINTVLRALQTRRRPARLLVVVSQVDSRGIVVGFGVGRVLHRA